MTPLDDLKRQLAELDELIRTGALKGQAARKARDKLEAQVLAAVTRAGGAPGAVPPGDADSEAAPRPSGRMLVGLAVFVLTFGVAGYAWLGNPQGLALAPGVSVAADAASAPHEVEPAQFEALAQRLAERLKEQPDDAEGWSMLGRSYAVMGKFTQALEAYQRAVALRPKDAQTLVDYADAMAMANGRKLAGEPEKLINQALTIDPDNAKALALAGTVAFDRGDAALAVRHWERAVGPLDPASEMAQRLKAAIDEARQRAGMPAVPGAAAADAVAAAPAAVDAAAAAKSAVKVRVSLAPALAGRADPSDTVFIFARAVQGPKAPLAIQRKQVKDLPLEVTLDDSMAMSPEMRLSTVSQVIIGARVSKSGNAMPQPGDLQGLSPAVAVGSQGVVVEIAEPVR